MPAEVLKIVSRDYRYRYATAVGANGTTLDLNDGTIFKTKADKVTFTPPTVAPILTSGVDLEGQDAVGQSVGNGSISVELYVNGSDQNDLAKKLSDAATAAYTSGLYVKWQPYGVTYPVYYEIVPPGAYNVPYRWIEFSNLTATVQLNFAVKPYALGDTMNTYDDFSRDSSADYFEVGGADMAITGGALTVSANLTTAHRLFHVAKGYRLTSQVITAKFTTGSSLTNFTAALAARADSSTNPQNWLDFRVGTTNISINAYRAGVLNGGGAALATQAHSVTIATGTSYWVRAVLLGNVLTCELFTSQPTWLGQATAAQKITFTLTGADIALFANGFSGISTWVPISNTATVDDLWIEPNALYNVGSAVTTSPIAVDLPTIPGEVDALADVVVDFADGAGSPLNPDWALLAWDLDDTSPVTMTRINSAVSFTPSGSLAVRTDTTGGTYRGGTGYIGFVGAFTAAQSGSAKLASFDPSIIDPGYYAVFARIKLSPNLQNGKLAVSVEDPGGYGQPFYTEYGSTGKTVSDMLPSANGWRYAYLGSIYLGNSGGHVEDLKFTMSADAGSAAYFGFDDVYIVPQNGYAAGRFDVDSTAGAIPFHPFSSGEAIIWNNLAVGAQGQTSARTWPLANGFANGSLVGSQIRLPAGAARVFLALTETVAGDTSGGSTSDASTYNLTARFIVTPRYRFSRGA